MELSNNILSAAGAVKISNQNSIEKIIPDISSKIRKEALKGNYRILIEDEELKMPFLENEDQREKVARILQEAGFNIKYTEREGQRSFDRCLEIDWYNGGLEIEEV